MPKPVPPNFHSNPLDDLLEDGPPVSFIIVMMAATLLAYVVGVLSSRSGVHHTRPSPVVVTAPKADSQ
ncbi:MAG TPA: hypothetical protein VD978_33245 [Azospirillum sp.]|nr:hypothetical protein [Azospirillum sp.]